MKRLLMYLGILTVLLAAPVERMDVGKLLPVQLVCVYRDGDRIAIETDTKNTGLGKTIEQALRNLEDTASGTIYLDTTEFLLVTEEMQPVVEELREVLKGTVRLCQIASEVDLQEAVKFLGVHGDLPKLRDWKAGQQLPVLSAIDG